jgi:hypothetical protein
MHACIYIYIYIYVYVYVYVYIYIYIYIIYHIYIYQIYIYIMIYPRTYTNYLTKYPICGVKSRKMTSDAHSDVSDRRT